MRIYERTLATVDRVDRENGLLRGVKLLGRHSQNGREYTTDAMRNARAKYEGKKVFLNHPTEPGQDRQWEEWAGIIERVVLREDGLYGDIRLRRKAAKFDEIIEAADEFGTAFGMSHVADGPVRIIDGIEIVESIDEVFSVDIVLDPATTAGLFEQADPRKYPKAAQDAIDDLSQTVTRFRQAAMKALDIAYRSDEAADFSEVLAALESISSGLVTWINLPSTGVDNDKSLADEAEQLVAALSDVFTQPLSSDSYVAAKGMLEELQALVDSLAGKRSSRVAATEELPDPIGESFRRLRMQTHGRRGVTPTEAAALETGAATFAESVRGLPPLKFDSSKHPRPARPSISESFAEDTADFVAADSRAWAHHFLV